ncbi:MAG: hypothetical protein AAFZ65_12005 [Planctomycetota bacterium]
MNLESIGLAAAVATPLGLAWLNTGNGGQESSQDKPHAQVDALRGDVDELKRRIAQVRQSREASAVEADAAALRAHEQELAKKLEAEARAAESKALARLRAVETQAREDQLVLAKYEQELALAQAEAMRERERVERELAQVTEAKRDELQQLRDKLTADRAALEAERAKLEAEYGALHAELKAQHALAPRAAHSEEHEVAIAALTETLRHFDGQAHGQHVAKIKQALGHHGQDSGSHAEGFKVFFDGDAAKVEPFDFPGLRGFDFRSIDAEHFGHNGQHAFEALEAFDVDVDWSELDWEDGDFEMFDFEELESFDQMEFEEAFADFDVEFDFDVDTEDGFKVFRFEGAKPGQSVMDLLHPGQDIETTVKVLTTGEGGSIYMLDDECEDGADSQPILVEGHPIHVDGQPHQVVIRSEDGDQVTVKTIVSTQSSGTTGLRTEGGSSPSKAGGLYVTSTPKSGGHLVWNAGHPAQQGGQSVHRLFASKPTPTPATPPAPPTPEARPVPLPVVKGVPSAPVGVEPEFTELLRDMHSELRALREEMAALRRAMGDA